MLQYSPRIVTDNLVMCLDPSQNKSYPTTDLPIKDQLNLWLDGSDDTTFSYSSGTTVSQWRDKSGKNNHAIVSGGSPGRSGSINGRKVVNFTSTSWFKCLTGSFTSNATHFAVFRVNSSSASYQRLYNGGGGGPDGYFFLGGLANNIATFWGNGGWTETNANSPSTTLLYTLRIVSAINNGSTATPYYDGTSMSTKTTNSAAYTGYELNSYSNGILSQPMVGDVCEIIVFNKQLTEQERNLIHTYLGQKWGISNTDRKVIDLSGFNDNGLLGNGTTSNMPIFDHYNKGSFKFNSGNKFIKLGTSTVINQFLGDFTVSLWAMATAANSNYGNLIGDYYTASTQTTNEWQIMMNNSSTALNVYRHGTGYIINNTASGFSANTWINVVLTRIGAVITLYANNTVIATATNTSVFGSATGNVNIGIDGNNTAEPFYGLISSVLIYNKGLTASEVTSNYNAQKSKFTFPLIQQGMTLSLDAGNPYSYAGAGFDWYDVSGNSYICTLINGPTYNNGTIVFDGTNDFVDLTYPYSVPIAASGNAVRSMFAWVRTTSTGNQAFISTGTAANSQSFNLVKYGSYIGVMGYNNDYYPSTGNAGILITDGVWHYIGVTFDGTNLRMYVDGRLDNTSGTLTYSTTGQNNFIGKSSHTGNENYTNGSMGMVHIYNRALSGAEVLQNYNATKGRFGR